MLCIPSVVPRGLQPALAAARHCPAGHRGTFFALVADRGCRSDVPQERHTAHLGVCGQRE